MAQINDMALGMLLLIFQCSLWEAFVLMQFSGKELTIYDTQILLESSQM
jgi:hypothetical protein